jgi:hypothetical protein
LVVVDKLTKYAHFIPVRHPYNAGKIAEVFVDNVYRLHGMPQNLISDRDPVFTSQFWQSVFKATGTNLKMSTVNHPETDGQTERVNQSVECYLRCFISAHPQHWAKWISLCEFWYNTNWHASLGKSPFELLYGRQPRYFGITATDSIASGDTNEWLQERVVILNSVRQHLLRMQQRMKAQADKHRTEREFAVGEEVFLKLQPYIQSSVARRANQKLAFKFFGPYQIMERVGKVAYKLKLPESSRVHPVFHVSQLKPCIGPPRQVLPQLPSPDDLFRFPVRILQQRARQVGHRTIAQVLVQWSDLPAAQATWEDRTSLQQQFPAAPAWGQAGSQERGIVSDQEGGKADSMQGSSPRPRPRRERRPATRYAGNEWDTRT